MGKRRNKKQRVKNSTSSGVVSSSGARQTQDLGYGVRPLREVRNPWLQDSDYLKAYETMWEARKIINIPVDDMLRDGWEVEGLDDENVKQLFKESQRLDVRKVLEQAKKLERLFGGSVILMGVKDAEGDASKPLDLSQVDKGDLRFLNVVARPSITVNNISNDPLSPYFGKPELYTINGQEVHESRLLVFDGSPISSSALKVELRTQRKFDGFGKSVLESLIQDIYRAVSSRQAATQLIERASVLLIINDQLKSLLESNGGQAQLAELDKIADQLSIYQAAMLDGKATTLEQWSANFGSVPELLEKYLQVLSAASDIPATRFLGQAPGGLNATGESDLENYYNMIEALRENTLRRQIEKLYQVLLPSTFGAGYDFSQVQIEFKPLWNASELELAQVRTADSTNIVNIVNAGIIDGQAGFNELKERGVILGDYEYEELDTASTDEIIPAGEILRGAINANSDV